MKGIIEGLRVTGYGLRGLLAFLGGGRSFRSVGRTLRVMGKEKAYSEADRFCKEKEKKQK